VTPRHGALLGIVGVATTAWLVALTGTYATAFLVTAGVGTAGALVFGLFSNAEPLLD